MRMKSMRCGYRVQISILTAPPGKSKSYYIIVGIFNDFEGFTVFR